MTLSLFLLYCFSGALAGLCAGMFGVGGGTIIVPALIFGFGVQGVHSDTIVHTAVGTSLAAIMVGLVSSAYAHWKRGALSWFLFARLAPGMLLGVLGGGLLASSMSGEILRMAVVLLLFTIGLKMLFDWQPKQSDGYYKDGTMFAAGGVIGCVCAFTGVGGGGMAVPLLNSCGVRMHQAIATSAACGVVISCAGTLVYVWSGIADNVSAGIFNLGYIDLTAVLCIALLSMVFAPWGAAIAHKMHERKLRIAFAWLLITGSMLTLVKWH